MDRSAPRFPAALRRLALAALALAGALSLAAHSADAIVLRQLNRRIAAAPRDGTLYFERAELRRAGRRWRAALADYETARRLAPELTAVELGLGSMWLDAGKPEAAVAALDRFLARSPGHADALVTRARALARLRRISEAETDYAAALAALRPPRDPQPELYLERADNLLRGGAPDAARALAVLDEGMTRLGGAITLQLRAVGIEAARGNPAGALARLDRIIARSPKPEIWREQRAALERQSAGAAARNPS
jgi:tetratricopeptide (TPR) repeat protein